MPRDYTWARRTIPDYMLSVGELSLLLGTGRHQARRILIRSGFPCRLIKRHWRDPSRARGYTRRAWAIPQDVALLLMLKQIQRQLKPDCRRLGIPIPSALTERIGDLIEIVRKPAQPLL